MVLFQMKSACTVYNIIYNTIYSHFANIKTLFLYVYFCAYNNCTKCYKPFKRIGTKYRYI